MINYCQNSEVLSAVLSLLGEYFESVIPIGEFEILVSNFGSELSCATSGLLEEINISEYYWTITMDLSPMASTAFMKYILLIEKCVKAFLIHLLYFVHLSDE